MTLQYACLCVERKRKIDECMFLALLEIFWPCCHEGSGSVPSGWDLEEGFRL